MHHEAYEGFGRMLAASGFDTEKGYVGLDVGGADVNGSVRDQLPHVSWIGLDIAPAPGVAIVADAATWRRNPPFPGLEGVCTAGFDIVIATELFEHTPAWREIIHTMALALRKGGPETLIATCASTGRPPHGARGEWGVPADQFYGNVDPVDLELELGLWFEDFDVIYNPNPGDAYMWARGVL